MIPEGLDLNNLVQQLDEDGVAFTNPELAGDAAVQAPIIESLGSNHGIAVVDVIPEKAADARDIAQELKDATGLDTVIVQTPINVSTVSDSYSRAQLESAQQALPRGLDQVTLLHDFYADVDAFAVPWGMFLGIAAVVVCLAAVAAFASARVSARRQ